MYYAEYSQHQDPAQLQRGLKLILKVGSNATPEYSANSPMVDGGPPTAAEAMMSPVPEELQDHQGHRERHKKSKKKKKKKDREKKHKHHKEKRHRSRDRHRDAGSDDDVVPGADDAACSGFAPPSVAPPAVDPDSSQDGFSFMDDDQSQPLPENILFFAGITTDNSPSNCPVSKPIAPRKLEDILMGSSPNSSSLQSSSLGMVGSSPTKPLPDVSYSHDDPDPSPLWGQKKDQVERHSDEPTEHPGQQGTHPQASSSLNAK